MEGSPDAYEPFGGLTESSSDPLPPAAQLAAKNIELVHTGDWQPGDSVSFTIRGRVVAEGESGNRPVPEADLVGYVVRVETAEGQRKTIPWSPGLLRYTVPATAGVIRATVLKPNGTVVSESRIPINPPGTKPPYRTDQPPKGTCVASPISQVGQPFRVYSPVGRLTQGPGEIRLVIRDDQTGTEEQCKPVAVSPRCAVFEPKGGTAGPHTFTVRKDGVFEETFTVFRLLVGLDTKRLQNVGKKGEVTVEVLGFPREKSELRKLLSLKPSISIVNQTPDVLAFTKDPIELTVTFEEGNIKDGKWKREIPTLAQRVGGFKIQAKTELLIFVTPKIIAK